ncbi:MAG: MBL fold metallo-hydrolase [Candidatus Thermoplasmatota archaeon]
MIKIIWHGHSCFEIEGGNNSLVTDPHDGRSIGIPTPNVKADIIFVSHDHYDHNSVKTVQKEASIVIDKLVEKNVKGVKIKGVPSFHDESKGAKRGKNIIYKFVVNGISFCHLGDLGHKTNSDILKKIGEVDILFIPIGGNFTIDSIQALRIIKNIKPNIAVPMHYKIGGLSLPIETIDSFLENNDHETFKAGNEVEIEREDIPEDTEIWIFTL